jgi:phosphate transport system protein
MSQHLQRELEHLHHEILSQAGIVEQMIFDAVSALCERRYDLVARVVSQDEIVNQCEVKLEEECLKLMALHQPVAGDLRRITTVLKVNADLERIADLGCNIAERAECMQSFPYFPSPDELPEMARNATDMVRMSLDAFVQSDSQLAADVIHLDARVDEQNRGIIRELKTLMQQDPAHVEPALHLFSAARHIERIADHAENIAEEVIYMIDGEIVRHKHGKFAKRS